MLLKSEKTRRFEGFLELPSLVVQMIVERMSPASLSQLRVCSSDMYELVERAGVWKDSVYKLSDVDNITEDTWESIRRRNITKVHIRGAHAVPLYITLKKLPVVTHLECDIAVFDAPERILRRAGIQHLHLFLPDRILYDPFVWHRNQQISDQFCVLEYVPSVRTLIIEAEDIFYWYVRLGSQLLEYGFHLHSASEAVKTLYLSKEFGKCLQACACTM